MRMIFIITISLLFYSCEGEETAKSEVKTSCEVTALAHNGCCSHHNGARSCGSGSFYYTSEGKLQCEDGTLSPSCTW